MSFCERLEVRDQRPWWGRCPKIIKTKSLWGMKWSIDLTIIIQAVIVWWSESWTLTPQRQVQFPAPSLILSNFPNIFFLIEEQLSMLKFIMSDKCHILCALSITWWWLFHMGWKSHNQVVEKPQPGGGKVNIVNDADITKPLLDMATRSR